jgi:hypothetical protein
MEMVRMSSDLSLKKDAELSQAAYLWFHSVFNAPVEGLLRGGSAAKVTLKAVPLRKLN